MILSFFFAQNKKKIIQLIQNEKFSRTNNKIYQLVLEKAQFIY